MTQSDCRPYRRSSGRYKEHYVCFACRKQFKKYPGTKRAVCPDCGKGMTLVDKDFRAPGKGDVKQWKTLKELEAKGFSPDGRPKW